MTRTQVPRFKVPQMILAELRRLVSSKMALLALAALLCVPILYGGLYLWANQDPYQRLSEVPVALVVEDQGAEVNGTERNLGQEVAKKLLASDTFDWSEVDAKEAAAGLNDGRWDFSITLGSGFSEAIGSISSADPHPAGIELRTNDANNYLASTIGSQAVERIGKTITQQVVSEAGLAMLDGLNTIRGSLSEAADGAGELTTGLGAANDGATTLSTGATALVEGTAQVRDGAASLSEGAGQVAAGAGQLAAIADAAGTVSADLLAAQPQLRADIAASLADAGLEQAKIDEVLARLDPVGTVVADLNTRVQGAVGEIDRLNAGAQQVSTGAGALATGAATVATGTTELSEGATQLKDGLGQLVAGSETLETGLVDGVAQIPNFDAATRAEQAKILGDPVRIKTDALTSAQNYGAGLAPFFAALAAWIGIYALFLIVKPISKRAVTALRSPLRVTLAGWGTPAMLGAVQMVGLFLVLSFALGFEFANPLATLGILIFASMTYTAIILALNVWWGAVGQFAGLVLMVVQLVTAGGTFPWQTLPAPLAALHHVLPMSYVVDAMRQVMYGGNLDRVWTDLGVLLCWLVIAGLLAAIGVTRMTRFRTLKDLQPSVIV
ncbi:YhgE/Pip domain-containing protein [Leucobacter insecticola]|uniref:YhgE/Pip domain-containing protein n=1 Tax=Leucobacter insecticola TaxID=2714934 RepID=A0A6G8FKX3_9MICO|nr:YhgE/Pip domain-containing protein [Leucobacter insecticola]QIM17086.1 YhgE/Pip domain-containing protein [Leucobacter insecticola]